LRWCSTGWTYYYPANVAAVLLIVIGAEAAHAPPRPARAAAGDHRAGRRPRAGRHRRGTPVAVGPVDDTTRLIQLVSQHTRPGDATFSSPHRSGRVSGRELYRHALSHAFPSPLVVARFYPHASQADPFLITPADMGPIERFAVEATLVYRAGILRCSSRSTPASTKRFRPDSFRLSGLFCPATRLCRVVGRLSVIDHGRPAPAYNRSREN
jgi:hypothetical protein